MFPDGRVIGLLAGVAAALGLASPARAERVRFHYAPGQVCANAPAAPGPEMVGERISLFGATEPYTCRLRPTQVVTFVHCYTGQPVAVPLRLPPDIPLVQHRTNRTIFNYGSYSVETVFLPDGSVDVIYNAGPFRPIGWCLPP